MMPYPKSLFHPEGPDGCRAVERSWANRLAGGVEEGASFVRKAATQPAATGHAAEVPLSGEPAPNASEPLKCV